MKFGAVPPREAEGAIAVHSTDKCGMVLKSMARWRWTAEGKR
jgi:hypothetical protein